MNEQKHELSTTIPDGVPVLWQEAGPVDPSGAQLGVQVVLLDGEGPVVRVVTVGPRRGPRNELGRAGFVQDVSALWIGPKSAAWYAAALARANEFAADERIRRAPKQGGLS